MFSFNWIFNSTSNCQLWHFETNFVWYRVEKQTFLKRVNIGRLQKFVSDMLGKIQTFFLIQNCAFCKHLMHMSSFEKIKQKSLISRVQEAMNFPTSQLSRILLFRLWHKIQNAIWKVLKVDCWIYRTKGDTIFQPCKKVKFNFCLFDFYRIFKFGVEWKSYCIMDIGFMSDMLGKTCWKLNHFGHNSQLSRIMQNFHHYRRKSIINGGWIAREE